MLTLKSVFCVKFTRNYFFATIIILLIGIIGYNYMDESITILTFIWDTFASLPICINDTCEAFCWSVKFEFKYVSIIMTSLYTTALRFETIIVFLGYLIGFILIMWLVIYMISCTPNTLNLFSGLLRLIKVIRMWVFTQRMNFNYKLMGWIIKFLLK